MKVHILSIYSQNKYSKKNIHMLPLSSAVIVHFVRGLISTDPSIGLNVSLRFLVKTARSGTSLTTRFACSMNLTWRDMQHLVVRTAQPGRLSAADWKANGVGRRGKSLTGRLRPGLHRSLVPFRVLGTGTSSIEPFRVLTTG